MHRVPAFPLSLFVASVLVGCSSGRFSIGTPVVRVVTYNMNHAVGSDGNINIERIADVINESEADIVALQEVDRWVSNSGSIDMMSRLSDLTGMTYAFCRNADKGGGVTGNGLLTRFPILEEKSILPEGSDSDHDRSMMLVLDVRGTSLMVINTEFARSRNDSNQIAGIRRILAETQGSGYVPVVYCGSFNTDSTDPTIAPPADGLEDCWNVAGTGNGYTYPSASPVRRVDYIFVSKTQTPSDSKTGRSGLKPQRAKVITTSASDHLPVAVDFNIVSE